MKTLSADTVCDLTWDEVARRLAAGIFAILPIGAAAKQHAWHLPMQTDALQAEWLAARLAERIPALVWPTLGYGYYPAFTSYAGSCSLSAATFETLVGELVASLNGFGARGVLVLDTGLSTIAPVARAIAELADAQHALHLKIYEGPRFRSAASRLASDGRVGHADEIETSCLLAIAPHLVSMNRAVAGLRHTTPGPLQHLDPSAANFSASGAIGDPARATIDKGRMLLAAMVEDLVETVEQYIVMQDTDQGRS